MSNAMNRPDWYLPLSESFCAALSSGTVPDFPSLARYEAAAVIFLQQLPKLHSQNTRSLELERNFVKLLGYSTDTLRSVLSTDYSQQAFTAGLILAPAAGVGLLDHDALYKRQFLHPDGSWNFDFSRQYAKFSGAIRHEYRRPSGHIVLLSDPQLRFVDTVRANPQESIEAQALAGTGKTYVLAEILELMPDRKFLFLADVSAKLLPIQKRFKGQIWTSTFKSMAERVLAKGNKNLEANLVTSSRVSLNYYKLAEQLAFGSIGNLSPPQVASLCWAVVYKFCESDDSVITTKHIPRNYITYLSKANQEIVAAASAKLWFKMSPLEIGDECIPVRGYHRIKQMSLAGLQIPEQSEVILVDEGHDLSQPMINILDMTPQPVIALGDPLQNLEGQYVAHKASIRHREMSLSLRAGPSLTDYVNQLVEAYPESRSHPFQADKNKETVVEEYDPSSFPPDQCVILTADEWGIFDWLIKSRQLNKTVAVIDWNSQFKDFIEDCLNLFVHGKRPTHGAISGYQTWGQLRQAMSWSDSFSRVDKWLEEVGSKFGVSQLYSCAELDELMQSTPSRYLVATVFSCKNYELPRLAISEDLYYFSSLTSKRSFSKKLALIYTAITRVSGMIYLPSNHNEWIDYILKTRRDVSLLRQNTSTPIND